MGGAYDILESGGGGEEEEEDPTWPTSTKRDAGSCLGPPAKGGGGPTIPIPSASRQLRKELLKVAHALVDGRALLGVLRQQKHKVKAVVMLEGLPVPTRARSWLGAQGGNENREHLQVQNLHACRLLHLF